MLRRLLSRSRFDEPTHKLYDALVAQARRPIFYSDLGVPDSLDGRFEMTVLHALLLMRRLRRIEGKGHAAAQSLFDLMFADFDRALRELGVGDLSVGPRIKKMGQAFYGRAAALDAALVPDMNSEALRAVLQRNSYGTVETSEGQLDAMQRYVMAQEQNLSGQDDAALLAGEVDFSGPCISATD